MRFHRSVRRDVSSYGGKMYLQLILEVFTVLSVKTTIFMSVGSVGVKEHTIFPLMFKGINIIFNSSG